MAIAAVLAAGFAWLWPGRPRPFGALASAAIVPDTAALAGFRLERVTLGTTEGRRLACVLRSPLRPVAARSLVGVVLLGGIGTGRRAALLVGRDFAGLVLSCDYAWRDPTTAPAWRALVALPRLRREVLETPEALAVAASFLLGREEMDGTRLAAVGASLGVPFVSAWAARDHRVAAAALVMGGAGLGDLFAANLGGQVRIAALRRPVGVLLAWLLGPLEPARTVPGIAPRPLLVIGAADDQRVPRTATRRLFLAAGQPKTILWFGGRHMQPADTALLGAVTDSTLGWITRHLPP